MAGSTGISFAFAFAAFLSALEVSAALAGAAHDLLVGEDGEARRAPVDRALAVLGKPEGYYKAYGKLCDAADDAPLADDEREVEA